MSKLKIVIDDDEDNECLQDPFSSDNATENTLPVKDNHPRHFIDLEEHIAPPDQPQQQQQSQTQAQLLETDAKPQYTYASDIKPR